MNIGQTIKRIMFNNKITQRQLAEKLGIRQQSLSDRLGGDTMLFDNVVETLGALGYVIEIRRGLPFESGFIHPYSH